MKMIARRRNSTQAVLTRRMREIWIDGFGMWPAPFTETQLIRTREAMRAVVEDQEYWDGLHRLGALKSEVGKLVKELKGHS